MILIEVKVSNPDLIDQVALYKLAERVDAWVKTPEGQASMKAMQKSIKKMLEESERNSRITSEDLLKRVTI